MSTKKYIGLNQFGEIHEGWRWPSESVFDTPEELQEDFNNHVSDVHEDWSERTKREIRKELLEDLGPITIYECVPVGKLK